MKWIAYYIKYTEIKAVTNFSQKSAEVGLVSLGEKFFIESVA
jgi:hypothetical protein